MSKPYFLRVPLGMKNKKHIMVCAGRFPASLPMTSGQMRFLPAVEMTGVSREKWRGVRRRQSRRLTPPYHQWHGVISTAGRNLICPLVIGSEARNLPAQTIICFLFFIPKGTLRNKGLI